MRAFEKLDAIFNVISLSDLSEQCGDKRTASVYMGRHSGQKDSEHEMKRINNVQMENWKKFSTLLIYELKYTYREFNWSKK